MSIDNLFYPDSGFKPSVQDDLWNVAESSNNAVTDMKYVWDVYVNDSLVIRSKTYPNPANGRGYFNASEVVRNYMSFDYLNANSIAIVNSYPSTTGGISIDYTISVGEDVSGVTSLNQMSGTTTVYNWTPSIFKRQQEGEGIIQKDNNFVTNRTRAKAGLTDRNLFIPLNITSDETISINVYTYGENNAQISVSGTTYTLSKPYVQLNISPVAINNLFSNLINSNVKYYKILIRSGTNPYPGICEITVDMVCNPKYESSQLHFINQYGMFDTARFDLVKRLSMNVEKKTFQKNEYTFRESGSEVLYYTYGKYNESKINYGSKIDYSYKLTMNYPSDSDYIWLAELINSPLVYFEKDSYLYPVSIKETNYEYSEHIFNGLKVLEINIDLNQQRFGFRR